MSRHIFKICIILGFVLGSCAVGDEPKIVSAPSRVLLVYMATDNNLSGYEQGKIQGLREGWTGNPNDHIIVYVDNALDADARLVEISNLSPHQEPRQIASYGADNSASREVLSRVIDDVRAAYPAADSYGLLIFSHASGWLPCGAYNTLYHKAFLPEGNTENSAIAAESVSYSYPPNGPPAENTSGHSSLRQTRFPTRSIFMDGYREMELSDFAAAVPDGVFDYIVFETCFMAGIEVAYELRNKTSRIFASSAEIIHPGFTNMYRSATADLFKADLEAFGKKVFHRVLTYSDTSLHQSATYSVINTQALQPLFDFIKANCDFNSTPELSVLQRFDRLGSMRIFFDFEDYYSRLLDTESQRAELSRLIDNCVIWKAATPTFMTQESGNNGFPIRHHCGLTTYIPQTQFPDLNEAYQTLQWSNATQSHVPIQPK